MREKSWKKVWNYNFFFFWFFFLKMRIFEALTFYFPSHLPYAINSIFSLIVYIYKFYVSDKESFTLSNHCCDNWKIVFFLLPWQQLLGKQIPSSRQPDYQSKLSQKKWSQTYKFSRKIVPVFCIITKVTDLTIKNVSKKIFFLIFTTTCHHIV